MLRPLFLTAAGLLFFVSYGCAPLNPSSSAVAQASGWRVDCLVDDIKATKECFAGTFGMLDYGPDVVFRGDASDARPFRILFFGPENGPLAGPFLFPGLQTWPGSEHPPTVRIDSNDPITDMQSPALFSEMESGSVAKAEYWVWPSGPERMTVDLTGYRQAYQLLLSKIGRTGP